MKSRASLEHVFDHLRLGAPVPAAGAGSGRPHGRGHCERVWPACTCLVSPTSATSTDRDGCWLSSRPTCGSTSWRSVPDTLRWAAPRTAEAPGRRDAAATTRSTRPLPGVAPGVLGQPARDAGLRRRATRLPGDRRRAGEATALLRAASGCQPRAEPTMEPPPMHGQPRRQQRKPAPTSVRLPRPRDRPAAGLREREDPGRRSRRLRSGWSGSSGGVASCPAVRPRLQGLPPDTPPVYAAGAGSKDQVSQRAHVLVRSGPVPVSGPAGWRGAR